MGKKLQKLPIYIIYVYKKDFTYKDLNEIPLQRATISSRCSK